MLPPRSTEGEGDENLRPRLIFVLRADFHTKVQEGKPSHPCKVACKSLTGARGARVGLHSTVEPLMEDHVEFCGPLRICPRCVTVKFSS